MASRSAWVQDSFAYADSFDETADRYRGLRAGQRISLADTDTSGLLVKGDVARAQIDAVSAQLAASAAQEGRTTGGGQSPATVPGRSSAEATPKPVPIQPKRFHGTVTLDAARVGRDAARVAEEVIAHLAGLVGANVTLRSKSTPRFRPVLPTASSEPSPRTAER